MASQDPVMDCKVRGDAVPRAPLAVKLFVTANLALIVPLYWTHYGPPVFLWFCDAALFLTLIGLWWGKPLLISSQALAVALPVLMWNADVASRLIFGVHLFDATQYMFDAGRPWFLRAISLYHVWLPILLVWMLRRWGYHSRAWALQSFVACFLLLAAFAFVHDPLAPAGNVNKLFGLRDGAPQQSFPHEWWLVVLLFWYPLFLYLPFHGLFLTFFPRANGKKTAALG